MLDKFASYNRFSNRSVELIYCMSKMNDLVVKFATTLSAINTVPSVGSVAFNLMPVPLFLPTI